MQQINNVHVKVQCDNEFRRFVLSEITYSKLAETIRSLLALAANSSFKLSYLDDEDDWVLFSTDNELQYAVSLSKSPLKISVSRESEVVALPPHPFSCPHKFPVDATEEGECKQWKHRGGRGGRGRGGRGGRKGEWKAERINAKIARLIDRHATLTAKLIEGELPEEKARALEWRLSHLQNKIDSMKAKKEYMDACAIEDAHQQQEDPVGRTTENEEEACEGDEDFHPHPHHAWHHRGGWGHGHEGRGRRGGARGGHCRRFGEHPHGPHPHGFGGPPFPFPPCPTPPGFGEHSGEGHPHPFGFDGEHPHPFFHHPPHHFGGEHGPRGGCKRRGERGECEGKGKKFFLNTSEGKAAFDRVQAAKEAVMAARRDNAEKDVMIAKVIELKEAKLACKVIKIAWWKEQREQRAK